MKKYFYNIIALFALLALSLGVFYPAQAAIVIGNPKGKIILTEVIDYQCGHCAKMDPIIQTLIADNSELKVRLIPVAIINQISLSEATSSYVIANETTHFLKYHGYLMAHHLTENQLYQLLAYLKLNTQQFQHEMHSPWVLTQMKAGLSLLQQHHSPGSSNKPSGTPLILIYSSQNPTKKDVFYGETSLDTLEQAISRHLS